ncbi:MAG: outer membrane protein assembly factor BamB [Gammaproteobacteria bacterium]
MKPTIKSLAILLSSVALVACQNSKDIELKPAELVPLEESIQVSKAWSVNMGGKKALKRAGLAPVGNGARVFAASSNGLVSAFDAITGKRVWQVNLGKNRGVSGGPGLGDNMVAVGTSEGEVIVLSAEDGSTKWETKVSSSVLAAPAVSARTVVVRTNDGQLTALDGSNGREIWNIDRRVQGLTSYGHAEPVLARGAVVTGFDNGKIAAVDAPTGRVIWERSVSERRGRNEFERLADVDGRITINGEDAFTVGFQGRAMLIALPTGQPVWAQEMSSRYPVAVDWDQVFVSGNDDAVVALDRRNGVQNWKQEQLVRRSIGAPALLGTSVIVGDYEGYMHWMSTIDGSLQARTRAGNSAISAPPLVMGDMIYVQNDAGELYAFTKPATVAVP